MDLARDEIIYLDNAATSWPKPDSVVDAIGRFYRQIGCAAGRGVSARSNEVDRTVERCRVEIARLVGCDASNVVFCFNGTDGLNLAISGLLRPGDHVVTTELEHNSVLRPLNELGNSGQIEYSTATSNAGLLKPSLVASLVLENTRLVCLSHVSNVTGIHQEITEIVQACRARNPATMILLDAAQSVGHIPVDFNSLDCDLLVAPGHKGLLGPLGTGFVCLSDRAKTEIRPFRFGGTGSESDSPFQPTDLPFRLEAGNLNVGGIFGLVAGIQYVNQVGIDVIQSHERELANQLISGLQQIEGVKLFVGDHKQRTGVVSFNVENIDPQSLASLLDAEFGIQVRAGYHCAPWMHRSLGTDSCGGTTRASLGIFNTQQDVEKLVGAVSQLASQLV